MNKTKFIFAVLLIAFEGVNLFAQENLSVEYAINSDLFETERNIKIFIPGKYFLDSTQVYTVSYILDAQSDDFWNMAKGNIGYLVNQSKVIPMIAIGISSDDRGEEFDPDSKKLKEHLRNEVFPFIEKEYRVNSFRTLIGHSWAGAFIGNILFSEDNDMFNAYIGISPSLSANDEIILNNADSILKQKQEIGKFFYCSSGDIGYREEEAFSDILKMDSIIQKYPNETLNWNFQVFKNTDHWSCVIPSINYGLIKLSRNYTTDQKLLEDFQKNNQTSLREQIEEFNSLQKKNFGFTFKPNYLFFRSLADDFREQGKFEAAKELYLLSIELGNDDVVCYFNLAQSYESLGDQKLSKTTYLKTFDLLEKQKDRLSNSFYNALKSEIQRRLK